METKQAGPRERGELQASEDRTRAERPAQSVWGGDVLVEREELLKEAERLAHFGSWAWDIQSGHVAWSDELYAILGKAPDRDPATYEGFIESIHPDDRIYVRELSVRASQGDVAERADFRIVRPDGSVREATGIAQIFRAPDGTPHRMVGVIIDVTEARQAERERERARVHLEDAQRLAHVGSWTFDLDRDDVYWSTETFRILGYSPDTRPSREAFLSRVHPDDQWKIDDRRDRLLAGEVVDPTEIRVVLPSGEQRTLQIGIRFQHDPQTGARMMLGTYMDVTERNRLEQQLLQSQKMEALGRLAGGIAHDFNNLLTVILLNVDSLRREQRDEPRIAQSYDAAKRAAALTSQLVAFSRHSMRRAVPLDLNCVIEEALQLIRRVIGEHIRIELRLSTEPAVVLADESQLNQVLFNLAANARDAMPNGGTLTISTALIEADECKLMGAHGAPRPGDIERYVRLSVRDTGVGIDPSIEPHIFEPLFTTKEPGKGAGLGLATVLAVVTQNRGLLDVESELGGGATFHVLLPWCELAPVHRRSEPPLPHRGREVLLIVEDDASVRTVVSAVLAEAGYEVLGAARPTEALELWRRHSERIALLVSDVVMPEMSGHQLIATLRKERPALPVVFVSGYDPEARTGDLVRSRFLPKPFTSDQLLEAVRFGIGGELEA